MMIVFYYDFGIVDCCLKFVCVLFYMLCCVFCSVDGSTFCADFDPILKFDIFFTIQI